MLNRCNIKINVTLLISQFFFLSNSFMAYAETPNKVTETKYVTNINYSPHLEMLKKKGAKISVFVENLNTGKTLVDKDSLQRLTPASLSKLVIAADALETWGPQKRFMTEFYRRGKIKNNVLNGDLVFDGGGDPALTNENLLNLIIQIKRLGIQKITGKLILNYSLFGDIEKDENRAEGSSKSHSAYDAPLSSAALNYSVATIEVLPPLSKQEKARVSIHPFALPNIKIENKIKTVKGQTPGAIFVERSSKNGMDTFFLSGTMSPKSPTMTFYKSISDANLYAANLINAYLKEQNIQISGKIAFENTPLKESDVSIAQWQSEPLSKLIQSMLKMSNNFIADTLTLQLGLAKKIEKKGDVLKLASSQLQQYMQKIIGPQPANATPLLLDSGSGLTPENKLSSKDLVSLLKRIYFSNEIFPEYLNALAAPEAEGSLKRRFSDMFKFNQTYLIRAKTGTLTEPQYAIGLAGYSRTKKGDWLAFSFIINSSSPTAPIDDLRQDIDKDLLQLISNE